LTAVYNNSTARRLKNVMQHHSRLSLASRQKRGANNIYIYYRVARTSNYIKFFFNESLMSLYVQRTFYS